MDSELSYIYVGPYCCCCYHCRCCYCCCCHWTQVFTMSKEYSEFLHSKYVLFLTCIKFNFSNKIWSLNSFLPLGCKGSNFSSPKEPVVNIYQTQMTNYILNLILILTESIVNLYINIIWSLYLIEMIYILILSMA